ncbi:hypothetical protein L798_11469 [Zootermopsis nevadensis]|uniref:Uncharacterized protein n=1 Tax=Zootermopsis nevadensis TaxID=136037 RepID=A0A067R8E8_ZOONE|nr:hypothetical protein L798_11469 [Zootermopsis nevadensis]
MAHKYIIHMVYLVDAGKKCNPVGFNYFHHHVILKILHTVEHTLTEGKRRCVRLCSSKGK